MEVITSYAEVREKLNKRYIYFDLDNTLITSVFTILPPHPAMVFCKYGEREPRYSIIRPGVYDLFKMITKEGFDTGILTDAKKNRAAKILKQFGMDQMVDVLITQEALIETEIITRIPRKKKPIYIYKGIHLFDDNPLAYEENLKNCTQVLPFLAQLTCDDKLFCLGSGKVWSEWNDDFQDTDSFKL